MAKGKKAKKIAPAKKSKIKKSSAKTKPVKSASKKRPLKKATAVKPIKKQAVQMKTFPVVKNKVQIKWSEFVTPLDDRVIVQLSSKERKTAGGLFIPDTAVDVSGNKQGVAVSVGRGHRESNGKIKPMDVRIGDHIVFSEHAGSKIELLGETLVLIRESEVMGILTS